MTITKRKVGFILLSIIIVFCGKYVIHLIASRPSYDINKLNPKKVLAIKINDRGILGNDSVLINDTEKVKALSRLIVSSPKINFHDFNIKASQGRFDVELELKDSLLYCEILKIPSSGGILALGNNYYRNDSLLNIVIENIRQKRARYVALKSR